MADGLTSKAKNHQKKKVNKFHIDVSKHNLDTIIVIILSQHY